MRDVCGVAEAVEGGGPAGAVWRRLVPPLLLAALVLLAAGAPAARAAGCPNEALRQGLGQLLGDCRAYEMVTPVDMNGNGLENVYAVRADGQQLVLGTVNTFGDAASSVTGKWRAMRGAAGWSLTSLNPPTLGRSPTPYDQPVAMAFSSDLSRALFGTRYPFDPLDASPYLNSSEPGNGDLYLVESGSGAEWVSHGATLPDATELSRALGGASEDLSRIFFETREPLTAAAEGSTAPNLYEVHEGTVSSVNVDSTGTLIPGGAGIGRGQTPEADFEGTEFQAGKSAQGHPTDTSAVSADGRTVVFTAPLEPAVAKRQVYVRREGETQEASLCRTGACSGAGAPSGALFLAAARDGSALVFYSRDQLVEGAPSGGGIYRFDVVSGALVFLTPLGVSTTSPGFHRGGFLAASADLSYLYLCESGGRLGIYHEGALTTIPVLCNNGGPVSTGSKEPVAARTGQIVNGVLGISLQGEPMLTPAAGYVFATTAGPKEIAVGQAQIASGEAKVIEGEEAIGKGEASKGETLIKQGEALIKQGERTREEGEAFAGYENAGKSEVYLYEAATGVHRCLSCRPDGSVPQGNAYLSKSTASFESRPTPVASGVAVANLTADGRRAFFVSEDRLVPEDVNGALDVYEWERAGAGTCSAGTPTYSTLSDGCLFLVSSGTDAEGAQLEGVSASGDDVFFGTDASLVRADTGTEFQLYDARVEGGLAWQSALPAPGCGGEGCRGAVGAPPSFPTAATATFSGEGNAVPRRRCPRLHRRGARRGQPARGAVRPRRCAKAPARRVGW